MNLTLKTTSAIALVVILGAVLLFAGTARSEPPPPAPKETEIQVRQDVWIDALAWCESRGNPLAVNKVDRDGTPSYGLLQFKPSTYAYFAKRYGMASTTDYMNPDAQRAIVRGMLEDPTISDAQLSRQQFPDCIQHKVGLPPR